MKILILSNCNSVHTIKWATSLSQKGIDVIVFSLGVLEVDDYEHTDVKVVTVNNTVSRESILNKLQYLKALPKLKKIIKEENPDILHAHYATSYGFLGALSRFQPFVLSVWGTDVFSFPKKSIIHKAILKYNFKKADKILSTSEVMAREIGLYTQEPIEVTPFGIDLSLFRKEEVKTELFQKKDIIIGTIKRFEKIYGINYLIDAFHILVKKHSELPLKLLLVGGGAEKNNLLNQINTLELEGKVVVKDKIPFKKVPYYHNIIDVYVALSLEESFGVAIIEASSCETPVVVSDVGGLPEVVEEGITGFVVTKEDPEKAAEAIEKLILNKILRERIGLAGRRRVKELYDWENNVEQMMTIYNNIIK